MEYTLTYRADINAFIFLEVTPSVSRLLYVPLPHLPPPAILSQALEHRSDNKCELRPLGVSVYILGHTSCASSTYACLAGCIAIFASLDMNLTKGTS